MLYYEASKSWRVVHHLQIFYAHSTTRLFPWLENGYQTFHLGLHSFKHVLHQEIWGMIYAMELGMIDGQYSYNFPSICRQVMATDHLDGIIFSIKFSFRSLVLLNAIELYHVMLLCCLFYILDLNMKHHKLLEESYLNCSFLIF